MRPDAITRRSLLAAGAGAAAAAAAARPNILFLLPDQVRACDLGYNGGQNVPTPNIDRLSRQGVVFTNALSTFPLCTPYRAMLQTGRWPALSGGVFNWINLPSSGQSMGDAFSRAGYDTGYIGKWHLWAGFRQGSLQASVPPPKRENSEFVPPGPARMGWRYWAVNNFSFDFALKPHYWRDTPERLFWPAYETDALHDDAMAFMRERARSGRPFFLTVAPHPPHPPWRKEQVPASSLDRVPEKLYWRPNVKGRRDRPLADPRCYYAMLGNLDDNVGRILKFLDESGLAENTIVVFTTDHGDMMASHGRYDKMVPYAEAVDVPLIVRWPKRITAGVKSSALFTPMDYFPTLAALAGVPVPGIVNGMDLSAQVRKQEGPQRDAALMMNFTSHWDFPETMTQWPEWRAVRTRQHTYVRWLIGAEELYDNQADPYQMRNLFDGRNRPAVMQSLASRLEDLLKEARDEFLPGTAYGEWFNQDRDQVRNAQGPVERTY